MAGKKMQTSWIEKVGKRERAGRIRRSWCAENSLKERKKNTFII